MSINSKRKGKRGELFTVNKFREEGIAARRTAQFCGKGDGPGDIVLEEFPELNIENKTGKTIRLYKAIEQAKNDGDGENWIVTHKRDRDNLYATVPFKLLCKFIKSYDKEVA